MYDGDHVVEERDPVVKVVNFLCVNEELARTPVK
jgi:hypothetical protein